MILLDRILGKFGALETKWALKVGKIQRMAGREPFQQSQIQQLRINLH